jgi:hypothetical protein
MDKASKPPAGFSADTEILTRSQGWVTLDQVQYLHEVATRSPAGQFEWQSVQRVIRQPYGGDLITFENKSIRLAVAPGQRLLVRRLFEKGDARTESHNWHIRDALHFAFHPHAKYEVPVISWWQGKIPPEYFELPGRPSARRLPAHERATKWLAKRLTDPWTPAGQVIDEAFALEIYEKPLSTARRNLGVTVRRAKVGMGWEMSAPTRTWAPAEHYSHMPCRGFRMPMKDFCAFLGLFLAEGWVVRGRTDIMVSQSPKSPDLPEIRKILATTGLPFRYEPEGRRFTAHHTVLSDWLGANTGHRAWNKYIPSEFMEYAPEFLEALLYGAVLGDGGHAPLGQRKYYSTSQRLADGVQEILQKLGRDSWVRTKLPVGSSALVPDRGNRHPMHAAFERLRDVHRLPRPALRAYNSYTYAVVVPNNIIYVRRDGRPAWMVSI